MKSIEDKLDELIDEKFKRADGTYSDTCHILYDLGGYEMNSINYILSEVEYSYLDDIGSCIILKKKEKDIDDVINNFFEEEGVNEYSTDLFKAFESPGYDVYIFTAAWIENGKLQTFNLLLERM